MKISTDHKWKNFVSAYDVPVRVLTRDFDYQDREDVIDGFFRYRDNWYHIDQFMGVDSRSPFNVEKWSGYLSDSFYSGILIRISNDGECYQIGTYIA